MHLDIAFKAFVGVLVAVIIIGSGLGVTSGFAEAVEANNYMESVSKVILESNFNETVIDKCIEEASINHFLLEIEVYEASKAGAKSYAKISLTYDFEIPLFGIKQQKIKTKII